MKSFYLKKTVILLKLFIALLFAALFYTQTTRAETFGRVYGVVAKITPTGPIAENGDKDPIEFLIKLGPDARTGEDTIKIDKGDKKWKIVNCHLKVKLHPDSKGSSDNGVITYQLLADISHETNGRIDIIYARNHGEIKLSKGEGVANIKNKYFTGTISSLLISV